MIRLDNILKRIEVINVLGASNITITGIGFDSRSVTHNSLFVAVKGTQTDGHGYIAESIKKGASAVVCERLPDKPDNTVCWIVVENSALALSFLSSEYFDRPSEKLRLVGVTGTNGKTSIASILYELFINLGYKAGLISTVGNKVFKTRCEATHTTPDPVQLNRLLKEMVDEGCEFAFMEVSSIALDQYRTDGLEFEGALFTNITHDHLDYHLSFDNYIAAKKRFFDQMPESSFALVNTDDKRGAVMIQNCKARKLDYSMRRDADFKCRMLEERFEGMLLNIDGSEVSTKFIGDFNAYNLLAVYATALELGADKTEVLIAISNMDPVEGRLEVLRSAEGLTAIVDYAHTPDALNNVLNAINRIKVEGMSLITVVGAGGDRDTSKRPEMGKIAALESNRVVLTSDNPRSEDPEKIIDDMIAGVPADAMKRVLRVSDRREAIKTALMLAEPKDIVLVAGKGHETYQEVKGVKSHFDDREEIIKLFEL
jgi:UDP-N-acetylmuramoyl-L-alanyl-D-glutamate--2,6-diaminopimelate ligase